jgi:hypothetical protein
VTKKQRAAVVELFDPRLPLSFWAKVSPEPNSACWIWTAALNVYGYGQFRINNKQWPAHRYAYAMLFGGPGELHVDHLCRVECCVNPAHLEAVTPRENGRRGIKGVLTTRCPHGHEYTAENTKVGKDNKRHCRACGTARSRARWEVDKAERRARRQAALVREGGQP